MPTYEYKCLKCRKRFEQFQQMTAKPLARCPSCRGKVQRLIGQGSGFLFKGSGFYITDHRSASYQKKAKEEKGPTASSK